MLFSRITRLLALGLILLVGACGFKPVYAPSGSALGLRGVMTFDAPDDRNSYQFVRQAEARLGRNLSGPLQLSYKITIDEKSVGLTTQQEITRQQLFGKVDYFVRKKHADTVLYKGNVADFTAFSTEGSTVSTASVERDAYRRLMVLLADRMVTDLMVNYQDFAP